MSIRPFFVFALATSTALGSAALAEETQGAAGSSAESTAQMQHSTSSTAQSTSNQSATPPPAGRKGMHHGMKGAMMKMADTDGDGTVSAEEMREMMQTRLSENDADGDGSLSPDEFEAMHMKMMREHLDERFTQLDSDGNGAISSDEMAAHADKMGKMQKMQDGSGKMGQGMKNKQQQ